ncbi:LysM peptidoglycan-binding domain-containing protein [bacterium]|nr:LysM peptidoglycan-binding domain-containing protein [bacterium]MBU1599403.1 LysM peptidoglycan-binding domain-containing protein [bacterium]
MKVLIILCLMLSLSPCWAAITPKEKGKAIVINRGDTLWDLAGKYYNDPFLWPNFHNYNYISNPDLIYPGERLVIGKSLAKELTQVLRQRMKSLEGAKKDLGDEISSLRAEIERLKAEKAVYEDKVSFLEKGADKDYLLKREAEIEVLESEVLKFQDQLTSSDEDTARLKVEIASLTKQLSEKEAEIKRKEGRLTTLEEELFSKDDEVRLLRLSIFELTEKIAASDATIEKKDRQIEKLTDEKRTYTGLAHFLIFALASGIVALETINQ